MSAWERARHIPWDRIPQDGSNLEEQKERIFRELQRETIEDELRSQERLDNVSPTLTSEDGTIVAKPSSSAAAASNRIPYSTMELLRRAAFGGTIGSITGAVFGFMDGMRAAGESQVLIKASNAAKLRFLVQGTTRSAALFGGFFGGFHVLKYGIRVAADPGEVSEIVGAGMVSLGALVYKPTYRASLPYAGMLIAMDCAQLYMRSNPS